MNKEHFKSIVLLLLVITNIFLGTRIWINKKLWPDGYNFFANTENSFIIKTVSNIFTKYNTIMSKTHISYPDNIIINTGYQTTRFSLNTSHEMYKTVNDIAYQLLNGALSSSSKFITQATKDEWYSILTGKSIYLSYSTDFDTKLFAQFLGIKETELSSYVTTISNIVIVANSTSSATIYIQDNKNNLYYKISISNIENDLEKTIDYFQEKFDDTDANSSIIINYSFDLFFDKAFGNQKAILQPMIPIYSNPQSYHIISSDNPMNRSDGSFNTGTIDKILKIFEINPNSVRRYTEANGTIVFVENNATLKISQNGILEYSALDNNKGLKVSNISSTSGSYDSICSIADFMDKINDAVSSQKNLYISSSLNDENIKTYNMNISFDYSVNGIPVALNLDNYHNAVSVKCENGYLKKYVQIFRSYDISNVVSQTPMYIDALDAAIAKHSQYMEQVVIDKMYISYFDNGSVGEKTADWNVKVKQ